MTARSRPLTLVALAALCIQGLAATASAGDVKVGSLTIEQPWVRATIGDSTDSAAYMKIENAGDKPDRHVSVKSDGAEDAMLHESRMEEGVMKMVHLPDGIEVPAHGAAELKPLGLHVMLMGLKQPLKDGATLPLTLTFANAGEVKVDAVVAKQAPAGKASMPDHEHMH
jgi:copper(I)-binding protein